MICRGSQTVARANFISGTNIPEERTKLLRDVISEKLQDEGKNVAIGACVYYKDCALRVDNVKQGVVTRVEVTSVPILFLLLQIKFLCHFLQKCKIQGRNVS